VSINACEASLRIDANARTWMYGLGFIESKNISPWKAKDYLIDTFTNDCTWMCRLELIENKNISPRMATNDLQHF